MSMTATAFRQDEAGKRRDGLVGLWGRIVHRDPAVYETWLEERDMTVITATLLRLNERQLNRLGFSRATLALDVEDLAQRAAREAQMVDEVLRIVGGEADADESPTARPQAIAAE